MSKTSIVSPVQGSIFSQSANASLTSTVARDIPKERRANTESLYFDGPSKFIRISAEDGNLEDVEEHDDYDAFEDSDNEAEFEMVVTAPKNKPSVSKPEAAAQSPNISPKHSPHSPLDGYPNSNYHFTPTPQAPVTPRLSTGPFKQKIPNFTYPAYQPNQTTETLPVSQRVSKSPRTLSYAPSYSSFDVHTSNLEDNSRLLRMGRKLSIGVLGRTKTMQLSDLSTTEATSISEPVLPPPPISKNRKYHKAGLGSIFVSSKEVQRLKQMLAYLESKKGGAAAVNDNEVDKDLKYESLRLPSISAASSKLKRASVAFPRKNYKSPYQANENASDADSVMSVVKVKKKFGLFR